jgi:hypothetical protein
MASISRHLVTSTNVIWAPGQLQGSGRERSPAGLPVGGNEGVLDLPVRAEGLAEVVGSGLPRQVADVELCRHPG